MVSDRESRTAPISSRAILRETEGLSASLLHDREAVLRWKDENPLRLVAAAILDVPSREMKGVRATKKSIGEQLVPDVMETTREWENLWDKIRPALGDSPHFDYDSENPRNGIRRRSSPANIPPVSLSEIAPPARKVSGSKITWQDWLESSDDVPMPKSPLRMNKKLAKRLREQDADLAPITISKLCGGIEKRVFGANKSGKASPDAWIKLLSASLDRWSELPASLSVSTAGVVGLTARLRGVSEVDREDWESLAESLAKYTSANSDNAGVMANAILIASSDAPRETTALLEKIHILLGESARIVLWRHLITSRSGQISDWLSNRWRNIPSADEKSEVATSLLMASGDAGLINSIDLLLSSEWRSADNERRRHLFNPILFGWLMRRALMPQCGRVLRELAEWIGENGASHNGWSLMSDFEALITVGAKDRLKRQGDDYENKLAAERGRLRDTEVELERAGRLEQYLRGELRKSVRVAALNFNRDAILILGETLQDLFVSPLASHQETQDAKARITLALLTLGAKPFGEIGETVPFNSGVHTATTPPVSNAPVIIKAPGVAYHENVDTPQTMVKAKVKVEEQAWLK